MDTYNLCSWIKTEEQFVNKTTKSKQTLHLAEMFLYKFSLNPYQYIIFNHSYILDSH